MNVIESSFYVISGDFSISVTIKLNAVSRDFALEYALCETLVFRRSIYFLCVFVLIFSAFLEEVRRD